MNDLGRKACLVVGGYVTQMPEFITYSGVFTKETVGIALTLTSFHNLTVKPANVLNACVIALSC